jgi:hypothetical protein
MSENDSDHSDIELEVPLFTKSDLPIGCRVLVKDGRKSGDRYEATILKHLEEDQVKIKWFVAGYTGVISLGQIRGKVELQLDQGNTRQSKRARIETKRFGTETASSSKKVRKQDQDSSEASSGHATSSRKVGKLNPPKTLGRNCDSPENVPDSSIRRYKRGRVAKKSLQTQQTLSHNDGSSDSVTTPVSTSPSEKRRKVPQKSFDKTNALRKPFHFSESKVMKKSAPSHIRDSSIDSTSPSRSPCHGVSFSNAALRSVREVRAPISMKSTGNRLYTIRSRLSERPGLIGQDHWKDGIRAIGVEEIDGALRFICGRPNQKDK